MDSTPMAPQAKQNSTAPWSDLWPDVALVVFLIGFDVAARLLWHVPNVSPVAASALFAGMMLRRRALARPRDVDMGGAARLPRAEPGGDGGDAGAGQRIA